MKITNYKKYVLVSTFVFLFGVGAFFAATNDVQDIFLPEMAEAAGTCGSCDDTPSPEPPDPSPEDYCDKNPEAPQCGGNPSSNPPNCDISASLSVAKEGDSYRVSWVGTPSNASFTVNDAPVDAVDAATYTFQNNEQERFVMRGSNGEGTCADEVVIKRETPPNPPTCNISANVSAIQVGGEYTIAWVGTPTEGIFKINDYPVAASDSATYTFVGPNEEKFTFTGETAGGTCSDEVIVKKKSVDTPICDFFSIAETQVAPGATLNLNWGTTNVSNVSISQGVGAVAVDGPQTISAPNTAGIYEYVLTFNGNTSNDCRDTVTVLSDHSSLTCSDLVFTSSASTVTPGSNVTLSWVWTGNVTSGTVNQGIGAVNSGDTRNVTINSQTTYTTTITGNGKTVSCPLTINVATVPNTITCASNVSFAASDRSLPRGGGNVTLTWNTSGLDTVSINGVSSNNLSDSEVVNVTSDRTYTLTGTKGTQTINCPLSIDVDTGGGGGGSNSPRCKLFEASDTKISAGQRVTLSWETSRTNEITLFEGTQRNGDEIFSTDDDDDVDEGEFVVRPTKDTTYTLLLERGSRDRSCKVEIEVEDNVVVLSDRAQEPRVAGIALTQVPYTGFEAGPALTILFYILLTLWGLFIAYTFVIKRDKILGFSLVGALPRKQSVIDASVEVETESEEEVARVADYVASATAAPTNLPTGNAPIVGYAAIADVLDTDEDIEEVVHDELTDLENRAHAQHALLSSDAMRFFTQATSTEAQFDALDALISDAKRSYPSEDGWVVINLERMQSLMDVTAVASELDTTPVRAGSLAEAIVTGNVAAAFELIGNRPMIALADATTDLDALYRLRTGGEASVSDLLTSESAHLRDTQIKEALTALTSALDGTYNDEKDAVRTAIMKAVKTLS